MKKMIILLLCLVLALSCGITGFAEGEENPSRELEDMGLELETPVLFQNLEGLVYFNHRGIVTHDPYFSVFTVYHLAFPKARAVEIEADSARATQEELAGMSDLELPVMSVIVTTSVDHAMSLFNGSEELKPVEFARKDAFHYCYVIFPKSALAEAYGLLAEQYPDAYKAEDLEKWNAEAEQVREAMIEALKAAEIFTPVDRAAELIGQTLQFETTDLDGNTVKSGDLFSRNKITMINAWGTWCPNCMDEMEQLGDLHRKLAEKNCGILGLEYEQVSIDQIREQALAVLRETGCDYPNVIMPKDHALLDSLIPGYPTTIFVDSEGRILTFPIVGAAPEQYEPAIDKLLNGEKTETAPEDAAPAASAGNGRLAYRVFTMDGDKPVEGVVIQFCSDDSCILGTTDAAGMAEFQQPQGEYTIHVLKAPDGYQPVQDEYKTTSVYGDITISLQAAE